MAVNVQCGAGLCVPQQARHSAVSYTHLDVYKRQEMRCVRHPYDTKGVGARKGIEY